MTTQQASCHTRVKICGITAPAAGVAAADAGADAIGLMFAAKSKRRITPEHAREIAQAVAGRVCCVGVFADANPSVVEQTLACVSVDLLQFHGSETPEYCAQFGLPYCKALAATPGVDPVAAARPYSGASYFMLDALVDGQFGGTGVRFDDACWPTATSGGDNLSRWMMAGGLDVANVQAAVQQLRPYAVDVSTGVEVLAQGRRVAGAKDPVQMADFVRAVRAADAVNADA